MQEGIISGGEAFNVPAGNQDFGSRYRFQPSVPYFHDGAFAGVSGDVAEILPFAEEWLVRLLDVLPCKWELEYIKDCVLNGSLLMPVFYSPGNESISGIGLVDVSATPSGDPVIMAVVYSFAPVPLLHLSQLCEIVAIESESSAVAIWSTVECKTVPGYTASRAGFGFWQAMPTKPIQ